jgi:hypothetical protein
LQKTAATAAAVVIGTVGLHVDKIFFPHDGLYDKAQVFGDWVAITFAHNLARILDSKFDF